MSGNIYLARQLFFILLTIICVSKIQIRHSDKSGSLQWAWVSAFNYSLLKIQWWIPACTTLAESQTILTITVPKTPRFVQSWNVRPQNTQPESADISWHPPKAFISSNVAFFLKVSVYQIHCFNRPCFFNLFLFWWMHAAALHWSACLFSSSLSHGSSKLLCPLSPLLVCSIRVICTLLN